MNESISVNEVIELPIDRLVMPRFTLEEAQRACDEWGLNCGPAAIAVISRLNLEELRPHLGDFEKKHYTNPTLMWQILKSIGARWRLRKDGQQWPRYGLVRIQWEGPWTATGVPIVARYRHTHWIASMFVDGYEVQYIFDINCLCVGGWVPLIEWSSRVVPWLLKECEPKASGAWHPTHVIEIETTRQTAASRG